ncbi:ABC-three component system middle component 1 [uncultured Pseudoalteromonas sp.]|uniref:ABC-three component system middle component 1 n=1 Tax=uncultured Pseudoalteromonas sp. TaxID=114053 RepID=UPI0030DC0EE0
MTATFSKVNVEKSNEYLNSEAIGISYFKYSETINSFLSCFCIQFTHEVDIQSKWERIVNEVALEYMSELNDSFSKWNCYLIFICSKPVSKEIKYKIENDKFAIRKIVIDDVKKQLTDDEVALLLNERILLSKIELTKNAKTNNKGGINLSDIANRILTRNIDIDATDSSIAQRKAWIENELERISINEN